MYSLRIINRDELQELLTMEDAIEAVSEAYRLFSTGQAGIFPSIIHEFDPGRNDMDLKAGYMDGAGLYGLKVMSTVADNPARRDMPELSGLVAVFSIETGTPLGLLDGTGITNTRTGAAGAVGARNLARKDSRHLLLIGAGAQGHAQLEGVSRVLPALTDVTVVNRTYDRAKRFVEAVAPDHPAYHMKTAPPADLPDIAGTADVIVTGTSARSALLQSDWIRPGTHITAIGTDMKGKQELDPELFRKASVVVDSRLNALDHGESQYACNNGWITEESVAEIGEVIAGTRAGRTDDEDITIFDATGMALQDILTGNIVLQRAAEKGVGTVVSI
ncbi:MAG: ornithine cyclodeaminase family protein [Synergistales bacterium]|nr:ornithine cyclodeaminase family protein [Synergistales bacterium]